MARADCARRLVCALAGPLLGAVVAGCDDHGAPRPRAEEVVPVEWSPPAHAEVGTAVSMPPLFEVRDARGQPIAGVPVDVAVTAGGGALSGAPTVSLNGPTPIGSWTLGPTAGPQSVTVSVAKLPRLVLTLAATSAAPALLQIAGGNAQEGEALAPLAQRLAARVVDRFGNGVHGIEVAWSVEQGGGSLAGETTSTTDASGIALAPVWTLGSSGEQSVVASFAALKARFTAAFGGYDISIRYVGAPPAENVQQAIASSVARLERVIVGDLSRVNLTNFTVPAGCIAAPGGLPLTEAVDDLVIFVRIESIDGPGGVLGAASPCIVRLVGRTPVIGGMRFDAADLQALAALGQLDAVIQHEMLHIIGIGTLWTDQGLLSDFDQPTVRFTGAAAREACAAIPGIPVPCDAGVPAENCLDLPVGQACPGGTRNAHWKESVFLNELMTGFLTSPLQLLSEMSVASLADLGYEVDRAQADPFSLLPAFRADERVNRIPLPAPLPPTYAVDAGGRLTSLRPR